MADAPQEVIVTFDILEDTIMDGDNILSNLSEAEQQEVEKVVTLLECAETDSLKQFENDTNLLPHKPVDSTELDRLANKNNAVSTSYQTKWTIAVAKGNYYCIFIEILHET